MAKSLYHSDAGDRHSEQLGILRRWTLFLSPVNDYSERNGGRSREQYRGRHAKERMEGKTT
jgi:hypothetical protein